MPIFMLSSVLRLIIFIIRFYFISAEGEKLLSAGALIGISIVVVFLCLVLLDVLLLLWRKQGIIAHCCNKKPNNKREVSLNSRLVSLSTSSTLLDSQWTEKHRTRCLLQIVFEKGTKLLLPTLIGWFPQRVNHINQPNQSRAWGQLIRAIRYSF